MTGIEATEEMTSDQLDAMAGGELLRNEVNINMQLSQVAQLIQIVHIFRLATLVKCATRKNRRSD